MFKERCATCHTLEDAGAVGMVGPNLDHPPAGDGAHARRHQQGPRAGPGPDAREALSGPDAQDVADYVATVSGR